VSLLSRRPPAAVEQRTAKAAFGPGAADAGEALRLGWDARPGTDGARPRFLETCSNPGCGSGWLHLWRSRSAPIFEGGWTCSAGCTAARVEAAVRRELDGRTPGEEAHRHRVPLGLVMLEQGWITAAQLRQALDAQRASGAGRLGQWLIGLEGVSEQLVTRALGLQWSCPVLPLEYHDPESLTALVPRLFLDAFGALPLRMGGGRIIYLGFEDRLDPVLALAVERMTGLRVESGMVRESIFRPAHTRMLSAGFPPVELIEAAHLPAAVLALSAALERARPAQSRLVRVHDCLWLRTWRQVQTAVAPLLGGIQNGIQHGMQDLICSVGAH
jgi:hypothetical protein